MPVLRSSRGGFGLKASEVEKQIAVIERLGVLVCLLKKFKGFFPALRPFRFIRFGAGVVSHYENTLIGCNVSTYEILDCISLSRRNIAYVFVNGRTSQATHLNIRMDAVFCNILILLCLRLAVQTVRRKHLIRMKISQINTLPLFTATSVDGLSTPDTCYINQKSDPGDEAKLKGGARLPWTLHCQGSWGCQIARQTQMVRLAAVSKVRLR